MYADSFEKKILFSLKLVVGCSAVRNDIIVAMALYVILFYNTM